MKPANTEMSYCLISKLSSIYITYNILFFSASIPLPLKRSTNDHFSLMHTQPIHTASLPHHEMLKEPRSHDVGGVFGQDPPLILGLLVFAVQQGGQVHVYLDNKHQDGKKKKDKKRKIGADGTA